MSAVLWALILVVLLLNVVWSVKRLEDARRANERRRRG